MIILEEYQACAKYINDNFEKGLGQLTKECRPLIIEHMKNDIPGCLVNDDDDFNYFCKVLGDCEIPIEKIGQFIQDRCYFITDPIIEEIYDEISITRDVLARDQDDFDKQMNYYLTHICAA